MSEKKNHWMGSVSVVFEVLAQNGVKVSKEAMENDPDLVQFFGPAVLAVVDPGGYFADQILIHANTILIAKDRVFPIAAMLCKSGKGTIVNMTEAESNSTPTNAPYGGGMN